MTTKIPVVTINCLRDLPQLDLQAQSIQKYLSTDCPVYIVVNENDTNEWIDYFDKNIRHYYKNHNLTILEKKSWNCDWNLWKPQRINPWYVGWETQQVLKLLVSEKINSKGYLILDSQNYLIKPYDPNKYDTHDRVPYRLGKFEWGHDAWREYCKILDFDMEPPGREKKIISICTPIFLHTNLVKSLISHVSDYANFAAWFKKASQLKSEFMLYYIWALKIGNFNRFHVETSDWANPYLRDSHKFDEDFEKFINFIGVIKSHFWISTNHRAWGIMSDQQYFRLKKKLAEYGLVPNFDQYRLNYVDLKF